MKHSVLLITLGILFFCDVAWGNSGEQELFSDNFNSPKISSAWTVREGKWKIQNNTLINYDGGLITLNQPPGPNFIVEMELSRPRKWLSVILFYTAPRDYGVLYLGGAYWETFEFEDGKISNFVQNRDPKMAKTGFHKIKVVCQDGQMSFFWDGEFKGRAVYHLRPGSLLGFRSLKGGKRFRLKNIRVAKIPAKKVQTVYQVPADAMKKAKIYKDRGKQGKLSTDKLAVDGKNLEATLSYNFSNDDVFDSCFARIPIDAKPSQGIQMVVSGDNSDNAFFVILHDTSGEQHLLTKSPVIWNDRQEITINFKKFLKTPPGRERFAIYWGGDGNQKLDFPLTAIDIGISKRDKRTKNSGKIKFGKISFIKFK